MKTLPASDSAFLLTIARRIVPEVAAFDARAEARFRTLIDEALSARPPALRRRLGLMLRLMRWAPALLYGRPFESLSPRRQDAVLRWFQECPLRPLRQGSWAVRTLVFLGYYGREEAGGEIGYAPSFEGADRLHA